MYRIAACITQQHHYGLLSLAVTICLVGSTLTALLLRRMINASGRAKWFLWALCSLIFGTTIWSTHFIAMLAYDPGIPHSYDTKLTLLSLAIATVGSSASCRLLITNNLAWRAPIGGLFLGLTISAMHYTGMMAYKIPGTFVWEPERIMLSVLLGVGLGTVAMHRFLNPVTRYCWCGGAVALVLAISAMHFTGMTTFTMVLSSSINVPAAVLTDWQFGVLVTGVTTAIFLVGFTSYSIAINLEHEVKGRLRYAATHDQLTGLPNRFALLNVLEETSGRLYDDQTYQAAVLTIDLSGFKHVNDIHGHAAGDTVLVQIAQRLASSLQPNEFTARTGGDEFIVLKQDLRRQAEAIAVANRLYATISEPVELDATSVQLGASIGISNTFSDGRDLDALVLKSDQAMNRAKLRSELTFVEFNADIDRVDKRRQRLVQGLRRAIKNDEFELVFQLQNSLKTLEPIGFESLLRWNHPEFGWVPPNEFIPLAEETGLILDIGLWVMRKACETAVTWQFPFRVAVNVAPQQLVQPSFVQHIADILDETGLSPNRLELEVTETSMIDDQENTLRVMHQIKSMGLRIAMDDFGTGYSSLATLQAFPFDKIKIDRAFITDVHNNIQRAAIVRATLLLGAALKIPILAEGVETEDELKFLQDENCNSVQGFYFAKPMSTTELNSFLSELAQEAARKAG